MRIAVYSPYLDTAGGGEKYILTIAECLSSDAQVDVLLDSHLATIGKESILERITRLHQLDLSKVTFIKAPLGAGSSVFERMMFLSKYDVLFFLTDGSIFPATSKKNIIHFQVPFTNTAATGLLGQLKQKTWHYAIFNSQFTKDIIDKSWNINGEVVYPPVDIENFKPLTKRKQILSVGRFFGYSKVKKHDVLIEAFKQLVDTKQMKGWSLHIAGGAGEGDMEYVNDLKALSKGYDIQLHPNLPFKNLQTLYGQSSIYWHAMGYGETDPTKFEHFGMTTVEAMAAGCVPIVINLGGQREIITHGEDGLVWDNLDQLVELTRQVISDKSYHHTLSANAIQTSQRFSKQQFVARIRNIVYGR